MFLGEALSLIGLAPTIRENFLNKTIQSDIVEIIDESLSKNYPYFNSKILIEFFSKKESISLVEEIRKGNDKDKELSDLLCNFLKQKKIEVDEPLEMLKIFIGELEQKIVQKSRPIEKVMYKKMDSMGNQLEKIYEKLNEITGESLTENTISKNMFSEDFMISWPENWEEGPKKISELSNQLTEQWMQKRNLPEWDSSKIKLKIKRKTNEFELVPTINIGVEKVAFRNIDEMFKAIISPFQELGFKIIDHHINRDEKSFTLNLLIPKKFFPEFPLKEDIYQFQKVFLKNDKQYIVTVTKVHESILKKKPEISDEIADILQSFAIL